MTVADEQASAPDAVGTELAPAPPLAGPVDDETPILLPPTRSEPALVQTLRFSTDPLEGAVRSRAQFGDVWQVKLVGNDKPFVLTSHPDHVESLFRAKAGDAPSLTGESPLRPILGPTSVLTSVGERHMRQRKLLLPRFHGEAVARYAQLIADVIGREIDTWPVERGFALAPRMQAVTLEVIMAGVFGIEGTPEPGSPEERMRNAVRRIGRLSTHPLWHLVELWQFGRLEPSGALRAVMSVIDRQLYAAIRARRAAGSRPGATDAMTLLLEARDEQGRPLSDEELRDELLTHVLAGHETTANSLAWTFERLLRTPAAHDRLRVLVRSEDPQADAYVEATVYEGMRTRPVIPIVVRKVKRRWRLGHYVIPADTPVAVSIVALHHRVEIYPDPQALRPERFVDRTPGTYTWIPFGGGIRRCLGGALAMAEQRVVLKAIVRRTDLAPHTAKPEPARQRNVTMIPRHGGRVILQARRASRIAQSLRGRA